MHDVGMLLMSKGMSIDEATQICNLNFRGACVHGVIMEHIDDAYENIDAKILIQECELLKKMTLTFSKIVYMQSDMSSRQEQKEASTKFFGCVILCPIPS